MATDIAMTRLQPFKVASRFSPLPLSIVTDVAQAIFFLGLTTAIWTVFEQGGARPLLPACATISPQATGELIQQN
jgi:hypothetical protein